MLIDRRSAKAQAKELIRTARPKVLIASLIVLVIGLVIGGLSSQLTGISMESMEKYMTYMQQGDAEQALNVLMAVRPSPGARLIDMLLSAVQTIISLGFMIFLLNVIRGTGAVYGNILDGFGYWWKVVILHFVMGVLIVLWSLLLIVPGIIAAYRYSMADYLLVTRPELGILDCIRESKRLTKGHKMELFKLDLSFLGWFFLCIIPIVGQILLIWVHPYHDISALLFYEAYSAADPERQSASRESWEL